MTTPDDGGSALTGREIWRTLSIMRVILRVVCLAVLCLMVTAAQAQTTIATLQWDVDNTPAVVNGYARTITVDGAAVTGTPSCVAAAPPATGTTCSLPVPALATGSHTVVIRYTSGSQSVQNTTTGLQATGAAPSMPSNLRITVTVTVTVP